jgi:hypothetical protein
MKMRIKLAEISKQLAHRNYTGTDSAAAAAAAAADDPYDL